MIVEYIWFSIEKGIKMHSLCLKIEWIHCCFENIYINYIYIYII